MRIGSSEVMHHSKGLLNKMNAMHGRVCNVFAICQQKPIRQVVLIAILWDFHAFAFHVV